MRTSELPVRDAFPDSVSNSTSRSSNSSSSGNGGSSGSGSAVKRQNAIKPALPYYWNGLAGGLASTASTTALFPLDTWKTWKMARPHGAQSSRWTFWCIYRGLGTKLFFRFPYQLAYQSTYSMARHNLQKNNAVPTTAVFALSGALAEISAAPFRVPMEVIKQRIQTGGYSSFQNGVYKIFNQEGVGSFYRKILLPQTLMYDVPYSILVWVIYEQCMNYFGDRSQFSAQKSMLIGGLSATITSAVTCPTDIVRTRICSVNPEPGQRLASIRDTVRSIYATEGPRYFFRGVIPRIMLCAPSHAFYMVFFEFLRHKFYSMHERLNDVHVPVPVPVPVPLTLPARETSRKIYAEATETLENAFEGFIADNVFEH